MCTCVRVCVCVCSVRGSAGPDGVQPGPQSNHPHCLLEPGNFCGAPMGRPAAYPLQPFLVHVLDCAFLLVCPLIKFRVFSIFPRGNLSVAGTVFVASAALGFFIFVSLIVISR